MRFSKFENFTADSKNLVMCHFEQKKNSGIWQTLLRCSIHTGYVF